MRTPAIVIPFVAVLAALSGCAPTDRSAPDSSAAPVACQKNSLPTLSPGTLTFGTDQPAYQPWYINDDPANGQGFESAVAYAVAERLGYGRADVRWVRVPFNAALAPGPKTFDANLSEFSITEERKQAVDFSSPYFNVTQAFITVPSSPAAGVTTVEGLRDVRLGAQLGTTSYDAARSIGGEQEVAVYRDNEDAKAALVGGQIDALTVDLPTSFAVQAEIPGSTIIGQLPPNPDKAEHFGIVLDKGSALTRCVSEAVDELGDDGVLFRLQKEWLAGPGAAPFLS
ncbi:amino acid ABC transporter substrate-binding protein [Mycolicibacterium sp. S2-37]|uniref:ABC transporter substrate-binding protein n=1 Tax=Mycolicibacterium sp. S2-37 TaxID=2810297 RepID=UPI001A94D4FD|nr:ABC transporter substrate-binding protein [Mycolicibacterium sp. S2-37]MBO0680157.1 amino acid ABC transporter substrate-binding protein [Mycolicibacterium sp. S2-37]